MKNLILCVLLMITSKVFAAEEVRCVSKDNKKIYLIKVNTKKITTQLENDKNTVESWNIEGGSIFSHYATQYLGGNEETLDTLSLDFNVNGINKINSLPSKTKFKMQILFGWQSLYFESWGVKSDEIYNCISL